MAKKTSSTSTSKSTIPVKRSRPMSGPGGGMTKTRGRYGEGGKIKK